MSQAPRHRKLPTIEAPSVSVVVSVYNEARVLPALIPQLHKLAGRCELVVADGGSCDGTPEELAREFHVLATPKGRARQMNEGARATSGDILFFLHADSVLPPNPVDQILRVARTHDAGCFGIRFDRRHPVLWFCSWMSNARGCGFAASPTATRASSCAASCSKRWAAFPTCPSWRTSS